MRILVMFDLPTNTPIQRKEASKFRKFLLTDGYHMVQYSVYSRVCAGNDDINKHINRLQKNLPMYGSIRVITMTDKQYAAQKILLGKKTKDDEQHRGNTEIF